MGLQRAVDIDRIGSSIQSGGEGGREEGRGGRGGVLTIMRE